jgi:hypothetical protein
MTELMTVLPPLLAALAIAVVAGLGVRRLVRGSGQVDKGAAGE